MPAPTATSTPGSGAPACAATVRVASDWALKPSGVAAGGTFRLLFVSSTSSTAQSTNIADYNTFVQGRAAAGHAAIRTHSGGFRVLGSTAAVDARDNTCTAGTGVPIYWLNSAKVADNNADLYDGSLDSRAGRNEQGILENFGGIWTGTGNDGTATANPLGHGSLVTSGFLTNLGAHFNSVARPHNAFHRNKRFYGLFQVFTVRRPATDAPTASAIAVVSTPAVGDTYRRGERILFEVTFSEAVTVRGTPQIALGPKNAADGCCSARGLRADRHDKLLKLFDTGGQNWGITKIG